jgi:hypothetical protein
MPSAVRPLFYGRSNSRQRLSKTKNSLELLAVSLHAPSVVVAILAAPRLVGTHCLNVPVWPRTYPYIFPGGPNDQLGDSDEDLGISYRFSAGFPPVREPPSPWTPTDPRGVAVRSAQAWHGLVIPLTWHPQPVPDAKVLRECRNFPPPDKDEGLPT